MQIKSDTSLTDANFKFYKSLKHLILLKKFKHKHKHKHCIVEFTLLIYHKQEYEQKYFKNFENFLKNF